MTEQGKRWSQDDVETALSDAIAARDAAVKRLEVLRAAVWEHVNSAWDSCADDEILLAAAYYAKWERRPVRTEAGPTIEGHSEEIDTAENVQSDG